MCAHAGINTCVCMLFLISSVYEHIPNSLFCSQTSLENRRLPAMFDSPITVGLIIFSLYIYNHIFIYIYNL